MEPMTWLAYKGVVAVVDLCYSTDSGPLARGSFLPFGHLLAPPSSIPRIKDSTLRKGKQWLWVLVLVVLTAGMVCRGRKKPCRWPVNVMDETDPLLAPSG